jgi:hypothetical protein
VKSGWLFSLLILKMGGELKPNSMKKYIYKNKRTGLRVESATSIDDENLELVTKVSNGMIDNAVVFKK